MSSSTAEILRAEVAAVVEHDRGTCSIFEASGEFGLANASVLVRGAHAAIEDGRELVVLDLSAVTLLDPAAVQALLGLGAHASSRDARLVLVPASAPVHRAVVLAGAADALPFVA